MHRVSISGQDFPKETEFPGFSQDKTLRIESPHASEEARQEIEEGELEYKFESFKVRV